MRRFEVHIIPSNGCKLSQDSGESNWEEQSNQDGLFTKLKTYAAPLFSTGDANCGWESYTRPGVCRKRRGTHTWSTPCTSTSTTTTTATTFEGAHHNAYGQFISVVRDNEWYYVPYGTLCLATGTPYYEYQTAVKLMGTATATVVGTSTTTATVTSTAGTYPCFTEYGAYTLMSSIDTIPWKWKVGDATPTPLITSGDTYKFKFLATFYDTIFGAFSGANSGAIDIRYSDTLPTMTALDFPSTNQLYKPDSDYGITGLVTFGRKALLVFGRKSMLAIDYFQGYTPPFEIKQILDGIGTADHKSVVVTDDAVYWFDRDRATFHEYRSGTSTTIIGEDVRKICEDSLNYLVDVHGSYDPKYDVVSWTLRSNYLCWYDFPTNKASHLGSGLASNPFANVIVEYHRPSKRWYVDSQRVDTADVRWGDLALCKLAINRVNVNQKSRMIVVPNYNSQLRYEIEEYYDQQARGYPMTRVEPILWHPHEDRHKRIQEVRVIFGGSADVPTVDNLTATSQVVSDFEYSYAGAASISTSASPPYTDIPWVSPEWAIGPEDNLGTIYSGTLSQTSYLLVLNSYAFPTSIPNDATITGVIASVRCRSMDATYPAYLNYIQLIGNTGAVIGDDQLSSDMPIYPDPVTSWVSRQFGASNSTWGASLTPAIIKSANFGIAIGATGSDASHLSVLEIDSVSLWVYYTYVSTTYEYDSTGATISDSDPVVAMSCIYGDEKHLMASTSNKTFLGIGTPDSNGDCVFYTDIYAKYYQFVWGQTPGIYNGADCPVAKIIVKGLIV